MSAGEGVAFLGAALAGGGLAHVLATRRLQHAPEWSLRTNVRGARVPAVLGDALCAGALAGSLTLLAARAAGWDDAPAARLLAAYVVVVIVMYLAGHADDRRGDEAARGFRGHFGALRRGRVTGGMLKIVGGGSAGIAAGMLLHSGPQVIATAALVALGANFVNLLDRAPGRAGKFTLLVLVPVTVAASLDWMLAAAGLVAALGIVLPLDLSERGMLGDAGANPLGAVLGLALGVTLPRAGAWVAVAGLTLLTAASEQWSFSAAIERVGVLRALDRVGRKRSREGEERRP